MSLKRGAEPSETRACTNTATSKIAALGRTMLSYNSDPSIKVPSSTRRDNEKFQSLPLTQALNYMAMASAAVVMYDQGRRNSFVVNASLFARGQFSLPHSWATHSSLSIFEVDLIWIAEEYFKLTWKSESSLDLHDRTLCCGSLLRLRILFVRPGIKSQSSQLTWQCDQQRNYSMSPACLTPELAFPKVESAYIASQWLNLVFTIAVQAILLVRVYALYSRSKKLLAFLLACFWCDTIVTLVISGRLFNSSVVGRYYTAGSVVAIGPDSFGSVVEYNEVDPSAVGLLGAAGVMVQLTLDVVLLAFALFAAVKHALEARRLHRTWSINPLVKALVADQIIYFIGALGVLFNGFAVLAGPHMVTSLRAQEVKTVEGASHGELSTIKFGTRDLPAESVEEREPEPEPVVERSARCQAEEEA
ncbi:hypothetical protein BV22DRAFT_1051882 [Leucogyrophana mollusca]|uniref:Uncharacterized protein n=1 Tax=Leucogyrophana mollusca TaxID=85980 RepID=A0ACB8AXE3_9AGAM|nr:hypothetical protein BV22DRAFT_1051882 [Leucogyrophana mollusca]